MDGWTDGRMDGLMDGRMDGWTDTRTDGWMDEYLNNWMDACMHHAWMCMYAMHACMNGCMDGYMYICRYTDKLAVRSPYTYRTNSNEHTEADYRFASVRCLFRTT